MDINKMTIEEKIGQMLCFSFHGTTYNEQLKFLVEDNHIGNIIHFARNITDRLQVTKLNHEIKKHAKYPMFISIDQEGGMVRRVVDEMTYIPGAMAFSSCDLSNIYEINYKAGLDLKSMGFNVNYAPVGDINNNPLNPVINSRSYSDNPDVVSKAVVLAAKGFQDAFVLPTVKHFPGHGDTNVDSHLGLPVVSKTIEEMKNLELIPFIDAINSGLDGIMVSHILYDKIDEKYPSSLSKKVIHDLLLDELGFSGLVTTDSLTMKAIWGKYEVEEIVLNSINAGNDVIVFCGGAETVDQSKVIEAFKKLVNDGKITEERINKSIEKIIRLKNKYCVEFSDYDLYDNQLSFEVVKKSITKVYDNNILPLKDSDNILVLSPQISLASLVDNENSSYETLGKYLKCKEIIIDNNSENLDYIRNVAKLYDKIILATYNLKQDDLAVRLFNQIDKNKTIVVALRSPYDIMLLEGVKTYICTYDVTKESLKALSIRLKDNLFSGKLPITLGRKENENY